MPAFGSAAVPSPMNIRRTAPGCHPPTATAGDAATGPTGPAVATDAATPSPRRDAARAVRATDAATGASPSEPDCNHDNSLAPGAATRGKDFTAFAEGGITDLETGARCRVAALGPET